MADSTDFTVSSEGLTHRVVVLLNLLFRRQTESGSKSLSLLKKKLPHSLYIKLLFELCTTALAFLSRSATNTTRWPALSQPPSNCRATCHCCSAAQQDLCQHGAGAGTLSAEHWLWQNSHLFLDTLRTHAVRGAQTAFFGDKTSRCESTREGTRI